MSEIQEFGYLPMHCVKCGRMRVEYDGKEIICEKCHWNYTTNEYDLPQWRERESYATLGELDIVAMKKANTKQEGK